MEMHERTRADWLIRRNDTSNRLMRRKCTSLRPMRDWGSKDVCQVCTLRSVTQSGGRSYLLRTTSQNQPHHTILHVRDEPSPPTHRPTNHRGSNGYLDTAYPLDCLTAHSPTLTYSNVSRPAWPALSFQTLSQSNQICWLATPPVYAASSFQMPTVAGS
jgi:hypothetical protein